MSTLLQMLEHLDVLLYIGDVVIADDVAIGANAVVVRSITEDGTTWGGIPAKKISDSNSHDNLNKMIFETEN